MVLSISTGSVELEFPIAPHLGVLRLLSFCQALRQYLKPVLSFVFSSLVPRCLHMFIGCLGFLFCDLPICCLCPLLCHPWPVPSPGPCVRPYLSLEVFLCLCTGWPSPPPAPALCPIPAYFFPNTNSNYNYFTCSFWTYWLLRIFQFWDFSVVYSPTMK